MPDEKEEVSQEKPEEEIEESTTANLFPDFIQEKETEGESEKKEEVPPTEESQKEQLQPEQPQSKTDYINLEELGDKKVKEIVNGKEVEVSLRDLIGADQKARAADNKFQEAAEQRRLAAEERAKLQQERNQFNQYQPSPSPVDTDMGNSDKENLRAKQLEERLNMVLQNTIPLQVEANKKRMKDKFSDFDNVFPKMQEYVAKMPNTPENDQLIQYFDKDPQGQELLYYKTKDMLMADAINNQPKKETERNTAPMERPVPPVVKVAEGTSRSSTNANGLDAEIVAAAKKAKRTNRDEDWAKILSLKGY